MLNGYITSLANAGPDSQRRHCARGGQTIHVRYIRPVSGLMIEHIGQGMAYGILRGASTLVGCSTPFNQPGAALHIEIGYLGWNPFQSTTIPYGIACSLSAKPHPGQDPTGMTGRRQPPWTPMEAPTPSEPLNVHQPSRQASSRNSGLPSILYSCIRIGFHPCPGISDNASTGWDCA